MPKPDVNVKLHEIPADQNPASELLFRLENGEEVKLKINLEFEGDWLSFLNPDGDGDFNESEARHGFAYEFFSAVTRLFS